jgi:AraC-like DNA-binding protein
MRIGGTMLRRSTQSTTIGLATSRRRMEVRYTPAVLLHLHRPGPPLDRFVELITYYAGYAPDHTKERLLPDGAIEIIVDLTDTPKHLYDRDDTSRATAFRGAWISGMRRGWIVIEAAPQSSMAVIRFRPGGAYPFLGFSAEGITDIVGHVDEVLGEPIGRLRDRVLEAPDPASRVAAIERWLLERAGSRLALHPAVTYACDRLFAPGGLRITDVVDELGYSQRHVLALFRRWVGLSPKQYGRVRRFQHVLRSVVRGPGVPLDGPPDALPAARPPEPDWAAVAAAHGYYDQSHLVRDFREFSGLSPGAYLRAFGGLENYLPLD